VTPTPARQGHHEVNIQTLTSTTTTTPNEPPLIEVPHSIYTEVFISNTTFSSQVHPIIVALEASLRFLSRNDDKEITACSQNHLMNDIQRVTQQCDTILCHDDEKDNVRTNSILKNFEELDRFCSQLQIVTRQTMKV